MPGGHIFLIGLAIAAGSAIAFRVCLWIREGREEMEKWGAFSDSDPVTARAAEDLQ